MIEEYLEEKRHKVNKKSTYQEAIYEMTVSNIAEYNKKYEKEEKNIDENDDIDVRAEPISNNENTEKEVEVKSQILITN